MLEVIHINEKERWNDIIRSFVNWDVYYLQEYAESLHIHNDGTPLLFYYTDEKVRIYDVVMLQDIHDCSAMSFIPVNSYFDLSTPYGYGGPCIEGIVQDESISAYLSELKVYAKENRIVSEFIRFHPLLQNQHPFENHIDIVHLKDTIYMDLTNEETIWSNIDHKNRNMIRKALKNEIRIVCDHGERLADFINIYNATMDNNQATDYYYFEKEYFDYILQNLKDNMIMFYAVLNEKVISASIFYYNERYLHYHLSGTLPDYRQYASTNLLLYTVAKWGSERNIQKFHLGGGVGAEDGLYSFKKKFNKNGKLDFHIGRIIFDEELFKQLINDRAKHDTAFDKNVKFLITYRAE